MKLISAQIENYRSIEDSSEFEISDVTCLVGKNEAGKTAVLQALHLLNPVNPIKGKSSFDEVMDYPSKNSSAYKKIKAEHPANVLTTRFEIDDEEVALVEQDLGEGVLGSRTITVTKGYNGTRYFTTECDEKVAVAHLAGNLELTAEDQKAVRSCSTIKGLVETLTAVEEPHSSVTTLLAEMKEWKTTSLGLRLARAYWGEWLPRFFYFGDYSTMRGRVSIASIRARQDAGKLDEADETFLSLIKSVSLTLEDFEIPNFERLTRELEGAANTITDEVMQFWTQNDSLSVVMVPSPADPEDEAPLNTGTVVNVRIRNQRHRVTVPFDERSRGFVWFFSFFAYFSNIEPDAQRETILLLDEPGLNLHATAQKDFLDFIENRLHGEQKHQVIYSTHSPFLIDPRRLDRARTVQDVDHQGTKVSDDMLLTDRETVFPLQTALGYELAQTLFVGPHCLLVEGPSDLLYLQLLSQAAAVKEKTPLDPSWTVTPVGGADKLSTFVSLLGANQLNVAVLMDAAAKDKKRLETLRANGSLGADALIRVSDVTGEKEADIEDLFDPEFYLELVNGAYADALTKPIKVGDLKSKGGRITARIQQHFTENSIAGGTLNHYLPAVHFLRQQTELLPKLSDRTIGYAGDLFGRLNGLLK